ncbi:MAG TPA: TIGR04283 family arsenosugar biosynthesis glycosyltransferase [Thermodesulfobacteriota bacterium]|nr:TIGR04283 family arsenosugar biosynthesis glycosyltransferase [Thermodesulfobacteriota bacterium]
MRISVIIPVLNEAAGILPCLDSVKSQQGEPELIVVDGGSVDETIEVVAPHTRVIRSRQGRAVQMNSGARQATGDVVLFLHADSCLPPCAFPLLEKALADSRIAGGTFMLRFDSQRLLLRVIAFFSRFRFRYFHYGDQGIFVRRSVFEQLRGFSEIPFMEDIDFLRRLRWAGRVTLLKQPVTTSARRFLERGVVRQQLTNIILVIFYLLGARPETLKKWYGG